MQNKNLFVLIEIRNKGEVGAVNMFKPSSIFSLTIPRQCFFCESFMLLVFHACHAVLSVPCSLMATWSLGPLLCDIFLEFLLLSIWCPGLGVVFDCIFS